ncbi:hypothetical protein KI387_005066, partial [Taxus chinensis]
CQQTFDSIKEKLTTAPILRGPDWGQPFHIHTDASNIAMGAILGKKDLEDH